MIVYVVNQDATIKDYGHVQVNSILMQKKLNTCKTVTFSHRNSEIAEKETENTNSFKELHICNLGVNLT